MSYDLNIPSVTSQIVQIANYVRNTHLPSALYKQAGGKKLVLPVDTRWNSSIDLLKSYLENWSILADLDLPDPAIRSKIMDFNLKRNAKDMINILTPISTALDLFQKKGTKISEAVYVWKNLGDS